MVRPFIIHIQHALIGCSPQMVKVVATSRKARAWARQGSTGRGACYEVLARCRHGFEAITVVATAVPKQNRHGIQISHFTLRS